MRPVITVKHADPMHRAVIDNRNVACACRVLSPARDLAYSLACFLAAAMSLLPADTAHAAPRLPEIVGAHYAQPVERYGHFAAGRPHEYAQLQVHTADGAALTLTLPEDEVFEDVQPRLLRLEPQGATQLIVIVASRQAGARLALIELGPAGLAVAAQSAPIGTPRRWLNPVGAADLDGDGVAEIAAVITPHIGGTLKVYRRVDAELRELAALKGFSNHVYGSAELGLSTFVPAGAENHVLLPDDSRRVLRRVALRGGALVEIARCALQAPLTGALRVGAAGEILAETADGPQTLAAEACR